MLDHIFQQRAKITNSISKSYISDSELSENDIRIKKSIGEEHETEGFQELEDQHLVSDEDKDNKTDDKKLGEDVVKAERPIAFTTSGLAIFKSKDHDNYSHFQVEDYNDTVDLYQFLFEKSNTIEDRTSVLTDIDYFKEKAFEKQIERRCEMFKSEEVKGLDQLFSEIDIMEKSDDSEELEKGLGASLHKYIAKVGEKYFYDTPEIPREVHSINDLTQYHRDKSSLDSIKTSLDLAHHSINNRDSYKAYNKKAEDFVSTYGHSHNSDEATSRHRSTIAGMIHHVDNRILENKLKRLEKGGQEDEFIKGLIIDNEFQKSEK
jgi:hypothetical protein